MKKINLIGLVLLGGILGSCSNKVDFGEQYEKIVYIVNSKEKIYYAPHEAVEDSKGSVSFYCSGTEYPGEDIHIKYKIDSEALETYNKNKFGEKTERYFLEVPQNLIKYETEEVVIRKGEEFGCLNFTVDVTQLSPERIYIIPITLVDASGYEISSAQQLILYVLRIQNEYAGDYSSLYTFENKMTTINKTAVAVSVNQILLPLSSNTNDNASYEDGYFRIQVNEDNSLTLLPYMNSEIEAINVEGKKTNYYDPETKTFYLDYNVFDQWGDPLPVREVVIKM